ncbi:MAG: hypothetical protein EXS64_03035 [Candidatus Latescibacteria bacterium]|nr:hypothetical protein [Candidatus Latescibacterota bacterium]
MSCAASEYTSTSGIPRAGQWQFSSSYRYFKSFRHFRGEHEEKNRVAEGTQVENFAHAADFGLSYGVSNRLGLTANVPILRNLRTSLYEHYGNSRTANPTQARFRTSSMGLGDVRLTVNRWMFNPETRFNGNLTIGVGVKMPTGNSNVQDQFHRRTADGRDSVFTKAVDQSIQIGDGGWGLNLEMQGFRRLTEKGVVYFNAFYLFNPKNMNSTPHSIADQYAARLGLNYALLPKAGLMASLGGRVEGIPNDDLIGKSEGSRRPGYVISLEPSLSYSKKTLNFNLNLPIALYRNRTQSFSDKQRTQQTGVYTIGDAAFADYLANFVISYQFGKKHGPMQMPAKE